MSERSIYKKYVLYLYHLAKIYSLYGVRVYMTVSIKVGSFVVVLPAAVR